MKLRHFIHMLLLFSNIVLTSAYGAEAVVTNDDVNYYKLPFGTVVRRAIWPKDRIPVALNDRKHLRDLAVGVFVELLQRHGTVGQPVPVKRIAVVRLKDKAVRKWLGAENAEVTDLRRRTGQHRWADRQHRRCIRIKRRLRPPELPIERQEIRINLPRRDGEDHDCPNQDDKAYATSTKSSWHNC